MEENKTLFGVVIAILYLGWKLPLFNKLGNNQKAVEKNQQSIEIVSNALNISQYLYNLIVTHWYPQIPPKSETMVANLLQAMVVCLQTILL